VQPFKICRNCYWQLVLVIANPSISCVQTCDILIFYVAVNSGKISTVCGTIVFCLTPSDRCTIHILVARLCVVIVSVSGERAINTNSRKKICRVSSG
jgi:hypothetical protein